MIYVHPPMKIREEWGLRAMKPIAESERPESSKASKERRQRAARKQHIAKGAATDERACSRRVSARGITGHKQTWACNEKKGQLVAKERANTGAQGPDRQRDSRTGQPLMNGRGTPGEVKDIGNAVIKPGNGRANKWDRIVYWLVNT